LHELCTQANPSFSTCTYHQQACPPLSRFFIDAGAHHPILHSNTRLLESEGWSGIAIDANNFREMYAAHRPRTTFVQALLQSNSSANTLFASGGFTTGYNGVVGTLGKHREQVLGDPHIMLKEMRSSTLANLLDATGAPTRIDFLSLDVEGAEVDVLRTFPFERYSISMIAVEHNREEPKRRVIRAILEKRGFRWSMEDLVRGIDDFYVFGDTCGDNKLAAKEDSALKNALRLDEGIEQNATPALAVGTAVEVPVTPPQVRLATNQHIIHQQASWAILGTGSGSTNIAHGISSSSLSSLVAVGTRSAAGSNIGKVRLRLGIGDTVSLGTYAEVLARNDIDIVYIGLPTSLKADIAMEACRRGFHVVVDKPFESEESFAGLVSACALHGSFLMDAAAVWHRQALRDVLQSLRDPSPTKGGGVRNIHVTFHTLLAMELSNNVRLNPDLEPGGVVGDLGYYAVAAVLMAMPPDAFQSVKDATVKCACHSRSPNGALRDVSGSIMVPERGRGSGVNASFSVSFDKPRQIRLRVMSEGDMLEVDRFMEPRAAQLHFKRASDPRAAVGAEWNVIDNDVPSLHRMVDFMSKEAIDARHDANFPARSQSREETRVTQRILDECLSSIRGHHFRSFDQPRQLPVPELESWEHYASEGVGKVPARLSQGELDQISFGYAALLDVNPEEVVYDVRQHGRAKTSLCSNIRPELNRPCATGDSSRPSLIAKQALEAIASSVVQRLPGSWTIAAVNVDVNNPGSFSQHPHWDWPASEEHVHYLFIPLVDLDTAVGTVEVWPGTHTLLAHSHFNLEEIPKLSAEARSLWEQGGVGLQNASELATGLASFFKGRASRFIHLEAGEVAMMRASLLHRGTANLKHVGRPLMTVILLHNHF